MQYDLYINCFLWYWVKFVATSHLLTLTRNINIDIDKINALKEQISHRKH